MTFKPLRRSPGRSPVFSSERVITRIFPRPGRRLADSPGIKIFGRQPAFRQDLIQIRVSGCGSSGSKLAKTRIHWNSRPIQCCVLGVFHLAHPSPVTFALSPSGFVRKTSMFFLQKSLANFRLRLAQVVALGFPGGVHLFLQSVHRLCSTQLARLFVPVFGFLDRISQPAGAD